MEQRPWLPPPGGRHGKAMQQGFFFEALLFVCMSPKDRAPQPESVRAFTAGKPLSALMTSPSKHGASTVAAWDFRMPGLAVIRRAGTVQALVPRAGWNAPGVFGMGSGAPTAGADGAAFTRTPAAPLHASEPLPAAEHVRGGASRPGRLSPPEPYFNPPTSCEVGLEIMPYYIQLYISIRPPHARWDYPWAATCMAAWAFQSTHLMQGGTACRPCIRF